MLERLTPESRVVGLDVKPPRRLPDGADFLECDLTSVTSTAGALWYAETGLPPD